MRKLTLILSPIVIMTFLFPSFAYGKGVTFEDLVKREGLYYKKFTDVPFTGKTTGQHQVTFKNGKLHGIYVTYHKNGQLYLKGKWKNGELDGPWVYYHSNGQLWRKGSYKDGKRDGFWVDFDMDGNRDAKFTGTYKDDKKISD